MNTYKIHRFIVIALLLMCYSVSRSQDDVPSLFVYPQAPDTCTTLESRSNYVIQHFWDGFDLAKPITNDASLIKTFRDYADVFKFGHRSVVLSSIRDFMFKLRSNATNLSKVGQIAEAVLYGPYADYWSDEVYVEFAKSLAAATVLKRDEREYYQRQIGRVTACQQGMVIDFDYIDAESGDKKKLSNISVDNILIILWLDNSVDSSIDRTRLATDVNLARLVDDNQVTVLCIHEDVPAAGWSSSLPAKWHKGYIKGITQKLDVRMIPSCYMIDKEFKLMNKNISIADLKSAIE